MWRWHELLPVCDRKHSHVRRRGCRITTPSRMGNSLGLSNLFVKDESSNPTGTFQSGAGYLPPYPKPKNWESKKSLSPLPAMPAEPWPPMPRAADMQAMIYMPKDTPMQTSWESRIAGAEVILVDGLISDAPAWPARRRAGMAGSMSPPSKSRIAWRAKRSWATTGRSLQLGTSRCDHLPNRRRHGTRRHVESSRTRTTWLAE